MHIDKNKSKNIKGKIGVIKNNRNLTRGIAGALAASTILSGCAKLPEKVTPEDDPNNEIYAKYDEDEIFKTLCDEGYFEVKNAQGEVQLYQIRTLALNCKKGEKLNEDYYLCSLHDTDVDILKHEKGPEYRKSECIALSQTSIMYKIFRDESFNLSYIGNFKISLKIEENELKRYINTWDGQLNEVKTRKNNSR